ncbi:hypothetical protein [Actinoplanes sp. NPDC048796]
MPATWSKYDDQRLPNPKDGGGGDGEGGDQPTVPSKRLQMNWTAPHTPQPPPKNTAGSGGGSSGGSSGADADSDGAFQNPGGGSGTGTAPDFDRLEVATDDLAAYEQNILTAAADLVSRFNALRDRSQTVLSEPIWGRGDGSWYRARPNHQNIDNVDLMPGFLPSNTAGAARKFVQSIAAAQQNALGGAADKITISGMFIEVVDATLSSYAQMDMMSVSPDPHQLKTGPDA